MLQNHFLLTDILFLLLFNIFISLSNQAALTNQTTVRLVFFASTTYLGTVDRFNDKLTVQVHVIFMHAVDFWHGHSIYRLVIPAHNVWLLTTYITVVIIDKVFKTVIEGAVSTTFNISK